MNVPPRKPRPFRVRDRAAEPPPMPPGLAARLVAAATVADVVGVGHALEERFGPDGRAGRFADLEPRDQALARSIVLASLRRLGTLRAALARFLDRGLPKKADGIEWILLTGAAQILLLGVPDHAAVDLAVHATRREPKTAGFAALVNAVLRNVAREREEILATTDPLADVPAWLAARWRKTYGEALTAEFAAFHRLEPTLDLSVKSDPAGWAEKLGGLVLPNGSVRLITHDPIPELEGFEAGEWWVQDAAAALPARLLDARPGQTAADLCAAPGGKTAQLACAGAHVVALDRSAERQKRLAANLARLSISAEISVGDVLNYQGGPFDAVLLDAPCSATGTIRRHPDVAWTKRPSDIAGLAAIQAKMLDRAVALTQPGGRLVYSTCSLEPEECEAQITALLRRNPDVAREPIEAAEIGGMAECVTAAGDLRTLPNQLPNPEPRLAGLDGFFATRLRRRK